MLLPPIDDIRLLEPIELAGGTGLKGKRGLFSIEYEFRVEELERGRTGAGGRFLGELARVTGGGLR